MLERLLQKPDDWLGANLVILAAASVFASAIATSLAQRTGYEYAVPVAGVRADRHRDRLLRAGAEDLRRDCTPSRSRCASAYIYRCWCSWRARSCGSRTRLAYGFLRLFGVSSRRAAARRIQPEELRTVVAEAGPDDPRASPADAAVDPRSRARSR